MSWLDVLGKTCCMYTPRMSVQMQMTYVRGNKNFTHTIWELYLIDPYRLVIIEKVDSVDAGEIILL
jgi:hypothetical protein